MKVGWFAYSKRRITHILGEESKTLCGIIDDGFQWCCNDVRLDYVECKKCKKSYSKINNV
jgi:hypothetical protein